MELLKACDQTNTACQQARANDAALIKDQDQQLEALTKENRKWQEEQAKPSNSRLLWFVAGMLTTGLTVYLVKK